MTETPAGPGDHYGDHRPLTVTPTPTWDSTLEGLGRWTVLASPAGWRAGVLFTDDQQRLGFIPVGADTNPNAPHLASRLGQALRSAKVDGAPAGQVFDWWAGQAEQALSAGPVVTGSLEQLRASL